MFSVVVVALLIFYQVVHKKYPRLVSPTLIALGERELGSTIRERFVIENAGNLDLVLSGFQKSCDCESLMLIRSDGVQEVGGSVIVPTGGQVVFEWLFTVRGRVGVSSINGFRCKTNDPARPQMDLGFWISKVKGGLILSPSQVDFGTLRAGTKASRTVHLFDGSGNIRRVMSAESNLSGPISVSLLSPDSIRVPPTATGVGQLVGHLELVAGSDVPCSLDGTVTIQLEEGTGRPDVLTVKGRVAPLVEIIPPRLTLPRSGRFGPVYHASCLVCGPEEMTLDLALRERVPGMRIEFRRSEGVGDKQFVDVVLDPDYVRAHEQTVFEVHLVASVGDRRYPVALPIQVVTTTEGRP